MVNLTNADLGDLRDCRLRLTADCGTEWCPRGPPLLPGVTNCPEPSIADTAPCEPVGPGSCPVTQCRQFWSPGMYGTRQCRHRESVRLSVVDAPIVTTPSSAGRSQCYNCNNAHPSPTQSGTGSARSNRRSRPTTEPTTIAREARPQQCKDGGVTWSNSPTPGPRAQVSEPSPTPLHAPSTAP